MKINPLPQSEPLIGDWFEKGIREFEGLVNESLIDCDKNSNKKKFKKKVTNADNQFGDCCLEFFYYYNPTLTHIPAYKNAIWIKIYNINGINVWLRVGFNKKGRKKVTVFSECYFLGITYEYTDSYALPPLFINTGLWFEKKTVKNISFSDILDKIANLLPKLCNDNCI